MKELIETSINGLVSILAKEKLSSESTSKLMEAIGTLQGLLILESRLAKKQNHVTNTESIN